MKSYNRFSSFKQNKVSISLRFRCVSKIWVFSFWFCNRSSDWLHTEFDWQRIWILVRKWWWKPRIRNSICFFLLIFQFLFFFSSSFFCCVCCYLILYIKSIVIISDWQFTGNGCWFVFFFFFGNLKKICVILPCSMDMVHNKRRKKKKF